MSARIGLAMGALLGAALLALGARSVSNDLATPRDLHDRTYVGSGECQRCHPDHHASWERTFHRTMTQEASDDAVLGVFDGRTLSYGGYDARMSRDEEERFVVSIAKDGIEVERAIVDRTVGSHRYQQFLAREGDAWWRLPIAWDVEEARFFHMNAAFLTPDPEGLGAHTIDMRDYRRHVTRWNDNCVFCHNVAPDPGLDPVTGRFATEVAELGIGCEACHGPGSEHAAINADPLRRYWLHYAAAGDAGDPTIISPARLDPERRADVCGRCHGQRITDDVGAFLERGDPFVPGDDLALYSSPLWHDTTLGAQERTFEPRFWGDGTARLTAYEYQGLLQSRCASEGALTCTDCHGMHEGDPSGQVRPAYGRARSERADVEPALLEGDAMCAGACHADLASPSAARQHAGHTSVACVDCHMPRIVYGVRDVHRSHRIDVPRPAANARAGRIDACTLCHLERDVTWAEREVARRSSREPQPTDRDGVVLLAFGMGGDPIQRAVILDAIERAPDVDRPQRLGMLLATMRDDTYPAVRHLAWRSLRALAHAPLAPSLFTSTDDAAARADAITRVRALLAEPIEEPDPTRAEALRERARDVAIEIGE